MPVPTVLPQERPSPASDLRAFAGARAWPTFLGAAALVLLSRLPFLGPGYGLDADAWRVAWAARVFATTGAYESSRAPGYPVHELGSALLARGGPLALTLASAVLAALAAGALALLIRRLGGRDALLASLALGSTPAFYLGSVQALDYSWALAFALGGLLAAVDGRPARAGLCAGLAIGCRLTSALWVIPLALALAAAVPQRRRVRSLIAFVAITAAVAAAAFAPVCLTYGARFLRTYAHGYPSPLLVIKNATVDLWGIPGTVGLFAVGLWCLWPGARHRRAPGWSAPALGLACGAGIVSFVAAYLVMPHEAAYLIPVAPLLLIVLGRTVPRRAFVAVCLSLVVSPWILDVGQAPPPGGPRSAAALEFALAGRTYRLEAPGPLLSAQARRRAGHAYVDRTLERTRRLRAPTVVEAGEWLPEIRMRLGGKRQGAVRFTYSLTPEERAGLRRRGVDVVRLRERL